MNEDSDDIERVPRAPAGLVRRLRTLHSPPVLVPPELNAAILTAARHHLARSVNGRKSVRVSFWLSAAAIAVLALFLATLWFEKRDRASTVVRQDIDRNGRVDILDAFALARRLERGNAGAPQFDINGDGAVDRNDIDAIAAEAVKLPKHKA